MTDLTAVVRAGVSELLAQYEREPVHALHVRDLSLSLFDNLQAWHGLGARDRLVLEAASSLHDIGWSVTEPDGKGHHKESARLIREHRWSGMPRGEIEVIALTARYHRKATPSRDHEGFDALSEVDRTRVCILAACLRLGDALDRRHCQFVRRVRVHFSSELLEIRAEASREIEEELDAAEKKGDLLAELYPGFIQFVGVPSIEP